MDKSHRPAFEPDGASAEAHEVVGHASRTQPMSNAFARFEFEAGRGNNGTKVLMVEWEDTAHTRHIPGQWQVSWAKKASMTLSAQESSRLGLYRVYFLLLPDVTVPPVVTITHQASMSTLNETANSFHQISGKTTPATTWRINPLPAIFPPQLGASASMHGKKGVLHTLWAKKRLKLLQREIEVESEKNAEGVALDMALREKEWIEHNFGAAAGPANTSDAQSPHMIGSIEQEPMSPLSPLGSTTSRIPVGGGRQGEKLKQLRVGTSEQELNDRNVNPDGGMTDGRDREYDLFSPDPSDIAISFPSPLSPLQSQVNGTGFIPHSIVTKTNGRMNITANDIDKKPHPSLAAAAAQSLPPPLPSCYPLEDETSSSPTAAPAVLEKNDLFAVAISPRSPDMVKSPFSSLFPSVAVSEDGGGGSCGRAAASSS